jgi:hypothetical protein
VKVKGTWYDQKCFLFRPQSDCEVRNKLRTCLVSCTIGLYRTVLVDNTVLRDSMVANQLQCLRRKPFDRCTAAGGREGVDEEQRWRVAPGGQSWFKNARRRGLDRLDQAGCPERKFSLLLRALSSNGPSAYTEVQNFFSHKHHHQRPRRPAARQRLNSSIFLP